MCHLMSLWRVPEQGWKYFLWLRGLFWANSGKASPRSSYYQKPIFTCGGYLCEKLGLIALSPCVFWALCQRVERGEAKICTLWQFRSKPCYCIRVSHRDFQSVIRHFIVTLCKCWLAQCCWGLYLVSNCHGVQMLTPPFCHSDKCGCGIKWHMPLLSRVA